ncbi:hypothetical protein P167DRAFT_535982 [Morchella conica CCBAS932]|uniref:Hypervirulence associated protein TUDOR domain-containing protein n=1 Tax=Morchella conica CCBAS932 TaxID=1392247 RepID=A0A3N4KNK7_9PEZI|nr:hypothetical protein P167DRAFT_535982 [Morchella conica CCBAS932]
MSALFNQRTLRSFTRLSKVSPQTTRTFRLSAIAMEQKYKEGQKVEYHPIGGPHGTSTSTGKIVRVLTHPDAAGSTGNTVKASESDPRYEIQNDNTGKTSAVKENNIERVL